MPQALALPPIVRWAQLPEDTALAEEHRLATMLAAEEAYVALPEVAARLGVDESVLHRTRGERLELIAHKRSTVVRLREEQRIDDTVLRQIQSRLDLEEVRLSRREILD